MNRMANKLRVCIQFALLYKIVGNNCRKRISYFGRSTDEYTRYKDTSQIGRLDELIRAHSLHFSGWYMYPVCMWISAFTFQVKLKCSNYVWGRNREIERELERSFCLEVVQEVNLKLCLLGTHI